MYIFKYSQICKDIHVIYTYKYIYIYEKNTCVPVKVFANMYTYINNTYTSVDMCIYSIIYMYIYIYIFAGNMFTCKQECK